MKELTSLRWLALVMKIMLPCFILQNGNLSIDVWQNMQACGHCNYCSGTRSSTYDPAMFGMTELRL